MKIGVGADHRGFGLKSSIVDFLAKNGHKIIDYGTHSEESVDYPAIAFQCAHDLQKRNIEFGILSCYTGQGMAMTANKVKGIRAAICTKPETAKLTRAHNNANILVIPGYLKFSKTTEEIIQSFLSTEFEGGRHLRRINLIEQYENKHVY